MRFCEYLYDFGDDWRHDLVIEKILAAVPGVAYPRCTGGRGAETPHEDSGGIWAFNFELTRSGGPYGRFDPAGLLRVEPHSEGLRDRIWWGAASIFALADRQDWAYFGGRSRGRGPRGARQRW